MVRIIFGEFRLQFTTSEQQANSCLRKRRERSRLVVGEDHARAIDTILHNGKNGEAAILAGIMNGKTMNNSFVCKIMDKN